MENHPIPQDITGFQFKLIGSMTVKQFLYLAVGVIIGWFIFSSSLFFLLKWPLVILFGGGGAALAFVPIGGRPMDTMIGNFIRAFFKDTTYIYDKTGGNLTQVAQPSFHTQAPVAAQVAQSPTSPAPMHVHKEEPALQPQIQSAPQPTTYQPPIMQMSSPVISQVVTKEAEAQVSSPQQTPQLQPLPQAQSQIKTPEPSSQKPVDLPTAPSIPTAPQIPQTSTTRQVSVSQTKSVGIPATPEVPNLVTGIIKDPRGNPLPNILVEIKDKEENPVRAFKTNGLGHFASATPLLDGTYIIEFEDIKGESKFQKVTFEAKGQIIMPFEIISSDKREELRKELFQN